MEDLELENIEVDLLIEALSRRYGYDFSHYRRSSFVRRLRQFVLTMRMSRISDIIPFILRDRALLQSLLFTLSVTVTEMFRDPRAFLLVRRKVIPLLLTYPTVRIWHAGCATGEEVYALAIMLKEEGIYDRCRIYATDFNDRALQTAAEGIYPADSIREYTANYQKAGGICSFSDYYHARYDSVIMARELRENIVFANHNLTADASFGEMHLIICRNVLIYFDPVLQERVLRLFLDSLAARGFLWLGSKESVGPDDLAAQLEMMDGEEKLFRRKGEE